MTEARATFGFPVYQGENFLDHSLSSARDQDYPSLEIVVSDNASTDGTAVIVKRHAAEDPRVTLLTQTRNLGATENYNAVFRACQTEFFAWNAHDDFSTSDFISSAVRALDDHPEAVVAIATPFWVDAQDVKILSIDIPPDLESSSPAKRFRSAARGAPAALVFGLFRSNVVAQSHLHGAYSGSDRAFVAEMMLYGNAVMAGASEFYLREHPERSVRRFEREAKGKSGHLREAWFATDRANRIVFPAWRRYRSYGQAVFGAPLSPTQRWSCLLAWLMLLFDDGQRQLRYMGRDLGFAASMVWGRFTNRRGRQG